MSAPRRGKSGKAQPYMSARIPPQRVSPAAGPAPSPASVCRSGYQHGGWRNARESTHVFPSGGLFRHPNAGRLRLWKQCFDLRFNFLCAGSIAGDPAAFAFRAGFGHLAVVIAGVAQVRASAAAVVGERCLTPGTAQGVATVPAEDIRGRAAPVQEQNGLLVGFQHLADNDFLQYHD